MLGVHLAASAFAAVALTAAFAWLIVVFFLIYPMEALLVFVLVVMDVGGVHVGIWW